MLNAGAPTGANVRRTSIRHRDFACKGDAHHEFRAAVKLEVTGDGSGEAAERTAEFMPFGGARSWQRIPICPACHAIAEERSTYDPRLAAVPAGERVKVWLSPDGRRVAVPGSRDAAMRDRYVVAGYREVEAHSMRDIDRIERIRAEQTGNQVVSEMQLSPEQRKWNEDVAYVPDSMTSWV